MDWWSCFVWEPGTLFREDTVVFPCTLELYSGGTLLLSPLIVTLILLFEFRRELHLPEREFD